MNRFASRFALLALLSLPCVRTSHAQPPNPAATPAPTDTDAIGPPFEVATVRPTGTASPGGGWYGTRLAPSGRLTVHGVSLSGLVYQTYALKDEHFKVEGGPAWAESQQYDIEAKVDESQMQGWDKLTNEERMARIRPMLRALLLERFHLKLHTEMRETPVYAVVQAKGGAKLKQVAAPDAIDGEGDEMQKMMRFMRDHPGEVAPGSTSCRGNGCTFKAIQIKAAVGQLGGDAQADRIVIDQSGLTGYYDFSYTISHEANGLTPMQQIEDQLGLRFESRKIPMKTYVIDAAEKPTQN